MLKVLIISIQSSDNKLSVNKDLSFVLIETSQSLSTNNPAVVNTKTKVYHVLLQKLLFFGMISNVSFVYLTMMEVI